ncbi:flagellar hook-basal body protein [Pandoraea bronchicola]|uniref:Flagellar basal-body rod protein FlgG n=1 Tax=Pandoraea bronchicola TaxID=2508287 RepID=A0A5E5C0C2_9BURK|nr:flagellar hook-basal body protein [Pandoraea bronchicola]VVE90685.1 flagellar basal-body rod protein FlgG [Pandoraea bronchicola]
MTDILAVALYAMQDDMARLNGVATNLANLSTPGYKRQVPVSAGFGAMVAGLSGAASGMSGEIAGGIAQAGTAASVQRIDPRPGTLKRTGAPLDFAINSEGFFEIATQSGPAYTRKGNFHVDARGRLVTEQGDPVMGKGGEIVLTGSHPVVDAAGNVTESGQPVAQLRVVGFERADRLSPLGYGMYAANGPGNAMQDVDLQVRQGYLENANVTNMQEMVQLMQTMRHFESMQKVAQGYDDMLGNAIRKLSD